MFVSKVVVALVVNDKGAYGECKFLIETIFAISSFGLCSLYDIIVIYE